MISLLKANVTEGNWNKPWSMAVGEYAERSSVSPEMLNHLQNAQRPGALHRKWNYKTAQSGLVISLRSATAGDASKARHTLS